MPHTAPITRVIYPGAEASLREAVVRIGAGSNALVTLAQRGIVEVVVIDGLRTDETRILERELGRNGTVLSDRDGRHLIVAAPLSVLGELSGRLLGFSDAMAGLAGGLTDALEGRATTPLPWRLSDGVLTLERRRVIGASAAADLSTGSGPVRLTDLPGPEAPLAGAAVRVALTELAGGVIERCAPAPQGLLLTASLPAGTSLEQAISDLTLAVASAVADLVAGGVARDRLAIAIEGPLEPAAIRRLGQFRCLRLPLVADCRAGNAAAELALTVLAAEAGVDLVMVDHVEPARAALDWLAGP